MQRKPRLQGIVRSRLELFEQRVFEGWTHQMLVDDLKAEGIEITLSYFATCLFKARKARDAVSGRKKVSVKSPGEHRPVAAQPEPQPVDERKKGAFNHVLLSDEELFGTPDKKGLVQLHKDRLQAEQQPKGERKGSGEFRLVNLPDDEVF